MSEHRVLYAIPSRGRANRMLVLKYLPESVKENLHIFVIPEEEEAYKKTVPYATIVPVPEWVDHIERKRLFMFKFAKLHGFTAVFMFDDDLNLAKWNPKLEKFRSVKEDPSVIDKFFRTTIPELFDKAPAVGLGCKFMAEQKVVRKGLIEVNGKMCCAFGYRVDEALKYIDWKRTYHLWNLDTMANLFFLTQGLPLLVHYGVTWSTDFGEDDPKKGGCALYRTQAVINEAFLRMIAYFPGLVIRKKKMSAHPTSFLQINWKHAYGHAIRMGDEATPRAQMWAKSMGLELPEPDKEYRREMRHVAKQYLNLELAIQGKDLNHLNLPNPKAVQIVKANDAPKSYRRMVKDLDAYLEKHPDLVIQPYEKQSTRKSLF